MTVSRLGANCTGLLRRSLMDTWAKFATAKPADVVAIRA